MRKVLLLGLAAALLAAACGDGGAGDDGTTTACPGDHRARRPVDDLRRDRGGPGLQPGPQCGRRLGRRCVGRGRRGCRLRGRGAGPAGRRERGQPGGVPAEHPPRPGHGLRRGPGGDGRPDGRGAALRPARRRPPRRLQRPRPGAGSAQPDPPRRRRSGAAHRDLGVQRPLGPGRPRRGGGLPGHPGGGLRRRDASGRLRRRRGGGPGHHQRLGGRGDQRPHPRADPGGSAHPRHPARPDQHGVPVRRLGAALRQRGHRRRALHPPRRVPGDGAADAPAALRRLRRRRRLAGRRPGLRGRRGGHALRAARRGPLRRGGRLLRDAVRRSPRRRWRRPTSNWRCPASSSAPRRACPTPCAPWG